MKTGSIPRPALLALIALGFITGARAVPVAEDPGLRAAALAEFGNTCARCHNADGTGYGVPGMPNFLDGRWQRDHPDAELRDAIVNGRNGKMPPFGAAFPAEKIDALVAYVRGLAPAGNAAPNRPEPPPQPIEPKLAPPGHAAGPLVLGTIGVYTQHNNNARTGANLSETILTPANVNPRQFGLIFRHVVDDEIFAQPLYVPSLTVAGSQHNVVIVATAANTLYAFDADQAAAPYWTVHLGPPASVEQHHFWCRDIFGNMGIIGTPVIDPATRTLYVVALTHEDGGFRQRLHALDIATGAERPNSPVVITADKFDPIMENQRAALVLANQSVYIGYSSHCDVGPYHGFLFRYEPQTLVQRAVINLSPNGDGNSIWQSGQGPAVDDEGSIYFVTSNGVWDGKSNFSDSFIKLDPNLQMKDWFTPSDYQKLDDKDWDLNATGAMLVPGTHEVMGVGKEGVVYLINTHRLGHLGDEHAVQSFRASTHAMYGSGVYWKSAVKGGLVYLWANDDTLHAFRFNDGRFDPNPSSVGTATSAYPGGMLSISANGTTGGILWANAALTPRGTGHNNGPAVLRAYDANDVSHELWNSNLNPDRDTPGRLSKNAPPTVVNGKVYLASFGAMPVGTGALYVYGLLR